MRIGTRVRCQPPDGNLSGSWPRYAGKVGTVTSVNREAGELGVRLDSRPRVVVWFRLHEIERVSGPYKAAHGRSKPDQGASLPRVRYRPL